jgi:oligopeptide/dipeptide ABC transporter ATP-binding protein
MMVIGSKSMEEDLLLQIKNLKVHFKLHEGLVKAVDGIEMKIHRGKTLGLVGESGCGKSVTAFSILQIISEPGRIVDGEILFNFPDGEANGPSQQIKTIDLAALNPRGKSMKAIRGKEIAMIFQEPMSSLSMMYTIGFQIIEAIRLHNKVSKIEARERAIELLKKVSIPKPEERIDNYPFQLSGGMRQRAMIAMALSCNPSLLIADEPTTALDVTTQAQIMELITQLQRDLNMSMLLITHDLGVVAETCDDVMVMYLGLDVEFANVVSLFKDPLHPYTKALLRSIPRLGYGKSWELMPITGMVPDPYNRPSGCPFHPRCPSFIGGVCDVSVPLVINLPDGRSVRCHLYSKDQAASGGHHASTIY